MTDNKTKCRAIVCAALNAIKKERNIEGGDVCTESISIETPPKPEMGDIGMPMFPFAKLFRMPPQMIAQAVVDHISDSKIGTFFQAGPYVNVHLDKESEIKIILSRIQEQKSGYGAADEEFKKPLEGKCIVVEYSSPNTNKPLHLGHMRNDALGESVSRILKKAGANVYKVNIINNRGIHICKSMMAYKLFHERKNETPESLHIKGDHFVGQCYVEFDKYAKDHPDAIKQAEEMLVLWEQGDSAVHALWNKMNSWAIDGIKETYKRTGVSFDKLYYESETYLKGKEEILRGLEKGIFFKASDGSVRVDVTEAVCSDKDKKTQEKVLLRKDGTSVYITQDIGTAISRHNDYSFDKMVYVVASEQIYHFKVLFYILKRLGLAWAKNLYHLSYGLVNLPSGRMKSREGTVVDADDLLDKLHKDALSAIKEKGRDKEVDDADKVSESVALAALHYYLLQTSPTKDMLFNPEESLSFTGNTGPYLQYMGARMSSILRRAEESGIQADDSAENCSLLTSKDEWDLVKVLGDFPAIVARAAEKLDPSIVSSYLYDLSKCFSKFYQQCPILSAKTDSLKKARLFLVRSTLVVLKEAMNLVLVPYLDKM